MAGAKTRGRLYHKAFNFDLIIAELKRYYPKGHYTKAYKDIKAFMKRHDIEHRQGSGYRSQKPLSDVDMLDIVDQLFAAFPWLAKCVRKLDVGEVYDLATMYKDIADVEVEIVLEPSK